MTNNFEIKDALLQIFPFLEEELEAFCAVLEYKSFNKNELLLKENEVSNGFTFIIKGGMRHFFVAGQEEFTLNFFVEHNWVADLGSLLKNAPSKNRIEATEATEVAIISLSAIHKLMDTYPAFKMLNGLIAEISDTAAQMISRNSKSPDQRYMDLLEHHPDWINRFQQQHIASFLGMTPETLSRVRARIR